MTVTDTDETCRRSDSQGFALMAALALMAMIFLLLVSLGTLLQVEIQAGTQDRKYAEARANALFGLKVALQELQSYTGPDQRVTARADLLNPDAAQPYWTGVWHAMPDSAADAEGFAGGAPHWLVSSAPGGTSPDPLAGPDPNLAVELVGEATAGSATVSAEKVPITDSTGNIAGHYAYWTGDEGVKANILPHEPAAFADINPASIEQLRRLNMAHQARWEDMLAPGLELTPDERGRLYSLGQLIHLDGNPVVGENFHDLTTYSSSVLADTRNGGLKKDLTRILEGTANTTGDATYNNTVAIAPDDFPDGPTWGLLRSFYNLGAETGALGEINPTVTVRPQTDTQHGVFPILTMVQMNWSARVDPNEIFPGAGTHRMQVVVQPVLALANPYNVRLEPATYTLRLEYQRPGNFEGRLQLAWQDGMDGYPWNQGDATLIPHDNIFGDNDIVLIVEDVGFEPGEARIFSLPPEGGDLVYAYGSGGITLEPGLNLLNFVFINFQPARFLSQAHLNNQPDIRVLMRWAPVIAELTAEPQNGSEEVVQRIERIVYSSGSNIFTPAEWPNAPNPPPGYNARVNRLKLRHSNHPITTVPSNHQDLHSGARWLTHYNMRAHLSMRDPDAYWVSNPLYDGQPSSESYLSTAADGSNAYWGPDIDGMQTHVALFDIPRQPVISLGTLQHANFAPESWMPAYPFANSWASPYFAHDQRDFSYALNEALWDRYFFSGLPANASLDDWPEDNWPNTRMRPQSQVYVDEANPDPLAWDTAAANLALHGGFNVNSASEEAWAALLKSLRNVEVPYLDPVLGAGVNVETSDSTTPYPRAEVPAGNSSIDARWRGFNTLSDVEIEELAREIVREVRNRGPFKSLTDFVNRSLEAPVDEIENLKGPVQAAIDRTSINDWWKNNDPHVPPFNDRIVGRHPLPQLPYPEAEVGPRSTAAPGFLTQADVLQVLAPVLRARSDTFLIRAYGNSINPLTGDLEAEAWCEAVVQRIPKYIDSTDNPHHFNDPSFPLARENQLFGRQYKILAFRWLQPNER